MPEKVKSKRGHLRTSAGRRQSLRVRLPIVGMILLSPVSSWLFCRRVCVFPDFTVKIFVQGRNHERLFYFVFFEEFEHLLLV